MTAIQHASGSLAPSQKPIDYHTQGVSHKRTIEASPSPEGQLSPAVFTRKEQTRARRRYAKNSVALVTAAIESAPNGRLTLREIYGHIHSHNPEMFPLDIPSCRGWQNTVRYNLSTNLRFVRVSPFTGEPLSSTASERFRHMCWALRDTTDNGGCPRANASVPTTVAIPDNAFAEADSGAGPKGELSIGPNPLSVSLLIN